MFKEKKVVILDLDGTLIDSVGIWNNIDIELIKKLSNIEIGNENIQKQRDSTLARFKDSTDCYLEYCIFLKEKYHMKESPEKVKQLRYEIANEYLIKKVEYKKGAPELLKYLKEKGYILALGSNTRQRTLNIYFNENENIIKKAKLQDYFSVFLTKDDVVRSKPDPEVHNKIIEKLNVKKDDCIIVEDSLIGVETAKNANIDVVNIEDEYSKMDFDKISEISLKSFKDNIELLEYIRSEIEN